MKKTIVFRSISYVLLMLIFIACNKFKRSCDCNFHNPFNSSFIRGYFDSNCIAVSDFKLRKGEGVDFLVYDTHNVELKLTIKVHTLKGINFDNISNVELNEEDFDVYSLHYWINDVDTSSTEKLAELIEEFDARILSDFENKSNTKSYFFVQHKYNRLIYQCILHKNLGKIEVLISVPLIQKKDIIKLMEIESEEF